jgi:hypothetical protein
MRAGRFSIPVVESGGAQNSGTRNACRVEI